MVRDAGKHRLEVTVRKGDTDRRVPQPIFLLTNGRKPIIISSFHGYPGARMVLTIHDFLGGV